MKQTSLHATVNGKGKNALLKTLGRKALRQSEIYIAKIKAGQRPKDLDEFLENQGIATEEECKTEEHTYVPY